MPSNQLGRGTTIAWLSDSEGASSIAFATLVTVTPASNEVGETETTLLASVFKPYAPTIPEGEGSFKIYHLDSDPGCQAMIAACESAPVPTGKFTITFPSGATLAIPGFPKKYAIDEVENESPITAELDYRQTAPWTYTQPS